MSCLRRIPDTPLPDDHHEEWITESREGLSPVRAISTTGFSSGGGGRDGLAALLLGSAQHLHAPDNTLVQLVQQACRQGTAGPAQQRLFVRHTSLLCCSTAIPACCCSTSLEEVGPRSSCRSAAGLHSGRLGSVSLGRRHCGRRFRSGVLNRVGTSTAVVCPQVPALAGRNLRSRPRSVVAQQLKVRCGRIGRAATPATSVAG